MSTKVWLGVDATRRAVYEPLGHAGVFGQTQRAGKTTSMREIVTRACDEAGAKALYIRTGTGDIPFPGAYPSTPYFRNRVSWQGVETMLWTFLAGEKPKTYRPILMKAVSGAKSLEDVHRNIIALGKRAHAGWLADRTYELDTYFQEILPWLRAHELADMVYLGERDSVVDLEGWPLTVKQLVIASTLDALMDGGRRAEPLLVVLPEARNFIPSDSKTPVTRAADRMAREGAKLNLFLWIDSQALTGVDQLILRNFALLLQGVQTSDIEISRVSKALEVPPKKIRALKVGDFIVHTQDGVSQVVHVPLTERKREENVDAKEKQAYEDKIGELETRVRNQAAQFDTLQAEVRRWQQKWQEEHDRVAALGRAPPQAASLRATPEGIGVEPGLAALAPDAPPGPVHLRATRETPSLTVEERIYTIRVEGDDPKNRLALLIAEGFLDVLHTNSHIRDEMRRRGWGQWIGGDSNEKMSALLQQFCEWGFVERVEGNKRTDFRVVAGAKDRITTRKVEVPA